MNALKLAILDCDGTLVDSQRSIVSAMTGAFGDNGLQPPEKSEILKVVGLPLIECIQTLLPNADMARCRAIEEAYRERFRKERERGVYEPPLYAGTRDFLETLHARGVMLAIATGKSRRGLTHTIAVHELGPLLVDSRTADDGPGKPNPDIVLDLLETWQVPAANACMIGDTTFDVETGVNAGIQSFGVQWGYHTHDALRAAGASAVVATWDELLAELDARFPGE